MLKRKLQIQYFADPGAGEENNGTTGANAPEIDYEKLASVVEKRTSSTENSVIKGYLKEQGLTNDELNQAIKFYKSRKEEERMKANEEKEKLREENKTLKAEILNSKLETKIKSIATEKKVSNERLSYLLRLIDRKDFVSKDEKLDEEKIKAAVDDVIKDFPELVQENDNRGFTKVGSSGSSNKDDEEKEKALRRAFGLK